VKLTRDGVVQYVEVDKAPAWDSGDRGKVKTKGKRGPGFK